MQHVEPNSHVRLRGKLELVRCFGDPPTSPHHGNLVDCCDTVQPRYCHMRGLIPPIKSSVLSQIESETRSHVVSDHPSASEILNHVALGQLID